MGLMLNAVSGRTLDWIALSLSLLAGRRSRYSDTELGFFPHSCLRYITPFRNPSQSANTAFSIRFKQVSRNAC